MWLKLGIKNLNVTFQIRPSGGCRGGRQCCPWDRQAAARDPGDGVVNGAGDGTVMVLEGVAMRVE